MVEIADFVSHAPVEPEIISEYRGRVPDELVELWEQYGYGTFGEGFLRVINPKLYEAEVGGGGGVSARHRARALRSRSWSRGSAT
ncbi:GAD-like domain-containing protein [Brevibacterium sediminis]|uniref:GAD-like domain-containing protein n=1 Tax=Brevibacterium sediminis TaxID=1857024 RepID=UPI003B3B3A26